MAKKQRNSGKTASKQPASQIEQPAESVKDDVLVSAKLALRQSQAPGAVAWTEQLRQAIAADGRSVYALAQATGLGQPQLHRFMAGAGITLQSAEQLARAIGWTPEL